MRSPTRPFPPVVAGVLLAVAAAAAEPAPPPGPDTPSADLVATVRSVDLDARACHVVTGVGFALRVVKVVVEPETRITRRGAAIGLRDLAPGMIVRVAFRQDAGHTRCASIEVREPGGES